MISRLLNTSVLLLSGAGYLAHATVTEVVPPRSSMATLPAQVGQWTGRPGPAISAKVIAVLGVDDYLNREYVNPAGVPVGLYVGYYASQRQGDTIHSPQNCLPGAGWQPVETGAADLRLGGRSVRVNQFLIQKGLDRQVVLYWYQGRGRVVANEYRNKAFLMLDAARLHRTNGGLVRLIAPINTTAGEAQTILSAFAMALFPHLDRHLP
jgi:EpsI family protein